MSGVLTSPYLANFVILGMAAVLTSVIRAPILSILLVTEMTGSFSHLLSLSIVSIISYLISNLLKAKPIYDSLLHRMIKKSKKQVLTEIENKKTLYSVKVAVTSKFAGKKIKELDIPMELLIISIERHGEELIPRGETKIMPGDTLNITTTLHDLMKCKKFFNDSLSEH